MRRFPGREAGASAAARKPLRSSGAFKGGSAKTWQSLPFFVDDPFAVPGGTGRGFAPLLRRLGTRQILCKKEPKGEEAARKLPPLPQGFSNLRLFPAGFPRRGRPKRGGPLPIVVYSFRARTMKVWLMRAAQPPEERGSGPDGLPSPAGRRDCSISFSTFRPCCARQLI